MIVTPVAEAWRTAFMGQSALSGLGRSCLSVSSGRHYLRIHHQVSDSCSRLSCILDSRSDHVPPNFLSRAFLVLASAQAELRGD